MPNMTTTGQLLLPISAGAAAAAAASWILLRHWRWRWILTKFYQSYTITNVKLPIAVLRENVKYTADDEGFVLCHIEIVSGRIHKISTTAESQTSNWTTIDCQGSIVFPCFVDAHTHMVKTETVPRNRNTTGTITEAHDVCEPRDLEHWKDDCLRRMRFAAKCAVFYGTRAIRTHLDGTAAVDPDLVTAVYKAYDQIQTEFAGRLVMQGVANLFLPLWSNADYARAFAERAQSHANTVLGAYCGNPGPTEGEATTRHLVNLFRIAQEMQMDVDMHIDESNDPKCCVLLNLCSALEAARNDMQYQGKVVLGHCCALSLQCPKVQQEICQRLGRLGNVFVVANPFTNLGLQDRRGSTRPFSLPISHDNPRTPQWRGLTLVQELRAHGVVVVAASDNVRDHWYPYGDYDLLAVWKEALSMGHLDTTPSEGAWADMCTTAAAGAMMVDEADSSLVGKPADLIVFPSARRASELLARSQADRIVLRSGAILEATLPPFSELDDLFV